MNQNVPKIIQEIGFDFDWDIEKVWKLDIPFWDKPNGYYNLKPSEVLENPEVYKEEFERTLKSDLSHPLDVMFCKNRWVLLDGLHRHLEAKRMGLEKINVRKITADKIKDIRI